MKAGFDQGNVAILGGGPAGLAIGYFLKRAQRDFTIFEARHCPGGNCITLEYEGFRFDTGAHRFHDKDAAVTAEIRKLVGSDLRLIEVPSQIWHRGRFVDFPLSPFNLLTSLGPVGFARAVASLVKGRARARVVNGSFEEYAVATYGRDIASRFLLDYSEKLWGAPCRELSPTICGSRLKGLSLASLVFETLFGKRAKTRHLDGAFYYPRQGYGTIAERMAEECGADQIRLESRVTRVFHAANRILAFEVNGRERIPVDELVSTLPIELLVRLLAPRAPEEVLSATQRVRFRSVVLVALFLAKEQVTANGSIYFPDPEFPFTRVYEPKNRSAEMAPPGHTSLVAEIPCNPRDATCTMAEDALVELVQSHFERLGWISSKDVIGATTFRMDNAYPILELDYETRLAPLLEYLASFSNLTLAGRNGCFTYSHLHDQVRSGKDVSNALLTSKQAVTRAA
jgi:protoporphyrinogen oxidase